MKKKFDKKKFASNIAISFFFAALFIVVFYFFLEKTVASYVSLINTTAVKSSIEEKIATYDLAQRKLISYPKYGKKYATIEIESIKLNLPVYYGDTDKILKLGVGHYNGSYFPGENGTIIMAAHNNPGYFHELDNVKVGDSIVIKASYGTFKYEVEKTAIVKETNLEAFEVSHDEEKLILYTCYPINRSVLGRKTQRYVVYAKKVGDNFE